MSTSRLIRTLQAATFVLAASYGVMFTMLDDYRDAYGISETSLGFVVGVGFFASFAAQLTLAPLADRGHARRLLVIGFSSLVTGCLLMGFGTTALVITLGRLLMGIGAGMSLPALRRIIIVSDPGNMGLNMGRLVSVDVAGFASGPVLAVATVDPIGISAPFVVLAFTTLVIAALLFLSDIPETASEDRATERFAFDLLRNRGVAGGVLIGLSLFLMIGTFDSLWAIMMEDLDAPSWMANIGITLFALPMIFLGPYGGKLAQRVGPYHVGAIGMLVGAVCMSFYGLLPSPYLMMLVFLLHATNDGFTVTSSSVAVAQAAPTERQAGAQGLLGGMQTLFGGLAASAAGWSYDIFGRGPTFVATSLAIVVLVGSGYGLAGSYRTRRADDDPAPVLSA
ncbi:MAG: MFS transporter [Ilumatobacteraceae bacterium]